MPVGHSCPTAFDFRAGRAKLDALSYTITADEVPAVDSRRHHPAGAPASGFQQSPSPNCAPPTTSTTSPTSSIRPPSRSSTTSASRLDQKAHAQIAVVTINSLDGTDIESYAVALYKQWGIGSKATDHGVLILLAVQDHKYRIEVGYGLEPILTDGKVGGFGREAVPLLRQNDYNGAVSLMTSRVADVIAQDAGIELTGDRPQFTSQPAARADAGLSGKQLLILGVILLIIMFTPAAQCPVLDPSFRRLGGGGYGGGYGAVVAASVAVAVASEDSAVAVPAAAAPAAAGRQFVAPAFVAPASRRLSRGHLALGAYSHRRAKFKDRRAGRPSSIRFAAGGFAMVAEKQIDEFVSRMKQGGGPEPAEHHSLRLGRDRRIPD